MGNNMVELIKIDLNVAQNIQCIIYSRHIYRYSIESRNLFAPKSILPRYKISENVINRRLNQMYFNTVYGQLQ